MSTSSIPHGSHLPADALYGKLRHGSFGHSEPRFDGPAARFVAMLVARGASPFTGHLGVLRQGNPVAERQRRYDFLFKHL